MSRKKEIIALQERVRELEASLQQETEAHAADKQALLAMQERIDLEERSFRELRKSCEEKLAAMDEQAERYRRQIRTIILKLKEKKQQQNERLQQEAQQAHSALKDEIAEERARAHEVTLSRIQAFGDNYNYYLSQLKLMMDFLTKAAMKTGDAFFLPDEEEAEQLFKVEFENGPELAAEAARAREETQAEADREDEQE